ncbi:MAG: cation:proton antiporter regulatory subunit, partial [Cyanobacteriota bacterium]
MISWCDRYLSIRPDAEEPLFRRDLIEMSSQSNSEWVTLEKTSPLVGMTLAKADIRNLTGVTVMTIQRGDEMIYYPKGKTVLEAGDQLFVVG